MTDPIDDAHAISLDITARLRASFAVLRARAATWEPRPMPAHFPGLDIGCPDSAGWACGRPHCHRCADGLARIDNEVFADQLDQ